MYLDGHVCWFPDPSLNTDYSISILSVVGFEGSSTPTAQCEARLPCCPPVNKAACASGPQPT